jgi:hypothetical protein
VSRGYGHRAPAPAAVIEAQGTGLQEFVSIIVPEKQRRAVGVEAQNVSARASGFILSAGATRDVVSLGRDAVPISCPPVEATGTLAYARFVNDRPTRVALIRGNRFQAGGVSFKAQGTVESFALRLDEGRAFVCVQGTDLYDLTLPQTVSEVVALGSGNSGLKVQA